MGRGPDHVEDRGFSPSRRRRVATSPPRIRTHPGEILREEYLKPLGMSANALARAIRVTPNRITAIVSQDMPRAITPDTALRLARYFKTTPEFWLNMQSAYDLSVARQQIGAVIEAEVQPISPISR
jgi:addiction module HigA family antidote